MLLFFANEKMFNIMDLHVLEAAKGGHNRKAVSLTWIRQHDRKRRFELTPFTLSTQPRPGIATTTFPINVQMAEIYDSCNVTKTLLFAGNLGSKGAYVTKEEPTRVYFAETLRREEIEFLQAIYIDGQVRIVIEVESIEAAWVKVESPFTIYKKSNDDYIVPPDPISI